VVSCLPREKKFLTPFQHIRAVIVTGARKLEHLVRDIKTLGVGMCHMKPVNGFAARDRRHDRPALGRSRRGTRLHHPHDQSSIMGTRLHHPHDQSSIMDVGAPRRLSAVGFKLRAPRAIPETNTPGARTGRSGERRRGGGRCEDYS
jgi:hypothetical protein